MKISVEVAMLLGAKSLSFEAFSACQTTIHVSAEPEVQLPSPLPPQPGIDLAAGTERFEHILDRMDAEYYRVLVTFQCETGYDPFRPLVGHRTSFRYSASRNRWD